MTSISFQLAAVKRAVVQHGGFVAKHEFSLDSLLSNVQKN